MGIGGRSIGAAILVAGAIACGKVRPMAASGGSAACTRCHGDPSRAAADGTDPLVAAAPPRSLSGSRDPATRGVGAHLRHVLGGPSSRAVACASCHALPVAGLVHPRQQQGGVTFSGLAAAAWPGAPAIAPAWNGTSCGSTYCHGAFPGGEATNAPAWTAPRANACGTCHGLPPPAPHPQLGSCGGCHPGYTAGSVDLARHLNGVVDAGVGPGTACGDCHAVPPDTGAHRVHYGDDTRPPRAGYGDLRLLADFLPAGASYYMFGCGNCHPLEPARHLDGVVEVELYDAAAPAGSLKARASPVAAYVGGSCSGVYCHSSGQASPTYATTAGWTSGVRTACGDCHGNPPRYPSGGAGTETANSHLVLADDGWELGHYAGLPGPWHATGPSAHGGWSAPRNAAPITCQTCHFDTTDPAATGPSGFYWLGTDGDYRLDLPGADATRLTQQAWLATQCSTCHPPVRGAVLPLRHVNGARDVRFDPRSATGALAGYPGAPSDPATAPAWIILSTGATWSTGLQAASYDAATRTCSNVGCHLLQTSVRWGLVPVGVASCDYCHQQAGVPPPP